MHIQPETYDRGRRLSVQRVVLALYRQARGAIREEPTHEDDGPQLARAG